MLIYDIKPKEEKIVYNAVIDLRMNRFFDEICHYCGKIGFMEISPRLLDINK